MKTTLGPLHPWVRSAWIVTMTIGLSGALAAQQTPNQGAVAPTTGTDATAAGATTGAATDATAAATPEPTPNVMGESGMIGSVTPTITLSHQSGYQGWLRKYDRPDERDRPFSLSSVGLAGYGRSFQYFLDGNDVFTKNGQIGVEAGLTDKFWLQASSGTLVRRLPVPYPNLVSAASVLALVSTPPKPGQPGAFLNLLPHWVMVPAAEHFNPVVPLFGINPTSEFRIDRSVNSAALTIKPFKSDVAQFFTDFSSSDQNGSRPLIFRSRVSASPTAVVGGVSKPGVSGIKFLTSDPVDSSTTDTGIGFNVTAGPGLISYRLSRQQYQNNVLGPNLPPGFPPAATGPGERIANSRFNDNDTTSHDAKLALPLGKDLALSGTWIRHQREHNVNGITLLDTTVPGTTPPKPITLTQNVKQTMDTKSGALRYTGVDNLQLTARYRNFDLDRSSPLLLSGAPVTVQNQSINRHEKEGELEASYSGLRSTLLRGSYTRTNVTRNERPLHDPVGSHTGPDNEWEHPILNAKSDTNTWRLAATTYLMRNATLRFNWKRSDTNLAGFHGTPSRADDLTLDLSYTPREDLGLFANYHRLNEKNAEIPVPFFANLATPLIAGDPDLYTTLRETQAGAQYNNKMDSIVLGLFKAMGTKVTLDANFTSDKTHSQNFWVIGTDAANGPHLGGIGDPTGLGPESTPYDSKNVSLSAGLTYAASKTTSVRGDVMYGRSNGATNTFSLFRLVPPVGDKLPPEGVWQPFDSHFWRLSLGAARRMTNNQQVLVDLSFNNWTDKIEPNYNGKDVLLAVGWRVSF